MVVRPLRRAAETVRRGDAGQVPLVVRAVPNEPYNSGMETPTPLSPPPFVLEGRYRCDEGVRLDEGTVLYEAYDFDTGTRVRVEAHEAGRRDRDALAARVSALRGLRHPMVMEIVDHWADDDRALTVTGPVEGHPLSHIVGERFQERVSRRDALDLVDALLSALEEFHERGLAHGAVGPETVYLSDDGVVRLLPVAAQAAVDPREDVRAVGELLCVMITGLGAEEGKKELAEVGGEYALLVAKATVGDPEHRPVDAAHYRALVTRMRDRLPPAPARHAADTSPITVPIRAAAAVPVRDRRRPLLLWSAVGAAVLVMAALLVWVLIPRSDTETAVVAASGGAEMPDLVGLPPDEATALLNGLPVDLEVLYAEVRDDAVEAGLVAASDPGVGAALDEGEQVTLSVSAGPATVEMPDLIGQDEEAALAELAERGFAEVEVVQQPSDGEPAGTVLATDPEAGLTVPYDDTATITVSQGIRLPDVVGLTEEDARAALSALGFTVEVVTEEGSERPEGEVAVQTPAAGSVVDAGASVVLAVSPGTEDEDGGEGDQEAEPGSGDQEDDGGPDGDESEEPEPGTDPCDADPWSPHTTYPNGAWVVHEGRAYESVWWNEDQSPEDSHRWGPWRRIDRC